MYSPALGRFIQPDTIVPDMFNPQSLNRYSYGLNNPSRYTDPSGHIPVDCYGTTYCGASNSDLLPDFKPFTPKPPKSDVTYLETAIPSADACGPTACTVDTDACPLGQTCISSQYTSSNLDPSLEDYLVMNFSYKFGSASIIFDRHGYWYLSFGGTIDLVAIPFYSFSLRRGDIDGFSKQAPDVAQTQLFLTGWSYNAGAGLILGASKTWSPGAKDYAIPQTATEYGLYVPASVTIFSASYTVNMGSTDDAIQSVLSIFR
jgi:hypothetical protein